MRTLVWAVGCEAGESRPGRRKLLPAAGPIVPLVRADTEATFHAGSSQQRLEPARAQTHAHRPSRQTELRAAVPAPPEVSLDPLLGAHTRPRPLPLMPPRPGVHLAKRYDPCCHPCTGPSCWIPTQLSKPPRGPSLLPTGRQPRAAPTCSLQRETPAPCSLSHSHTRDPFPLTLVPGGRAQCRHVTWLHHVSVTPSLHAPGTVGAWLPSRPAGHVMRTRTRAGRRRSRPQSLP